MLMIIKIIFLGLAYGCKNFDVFTDHVQTVNKPTLISGSLRDMSISRNS